MNGQFYFYANSFAPNPIFFRLGKILEQLFGMSNIGVPLKLLHEAQGLTVTLEMKSGQTYRGKLVEVEDTMNVQLKDVSMIDRQGRTTLMENVLIRGSQIRYFVIPDNLKYAPYLSLKPPVTNILPAAQATTNAPLAGPTQPARGIRGRGRARR